MDEEEVKSSVEAFTAGLPYWQFNQGTEWSYYPPSISALIERQWKHQKDLPEHSQKYVPVFWCQNSGDRQYKISIDLLIQYDINSDSMVQIRRHPSAPQPIHSPNCPKCRFKISLDASICTICGTKLQPQSQIKSHQNHKNIISTNLVGAQKPEVQDQYAMDDDVKMIGNEVLPPITEELNAEKEPNPFLKNDEVLCPSCCTLNKSNFNFCTKCGFNLKVDDDPQPQISLKAEEDGGGHGTGSIDDMEMDEKGPGMVGNVPLAIDDTMEEFNPFIQNAEDNGNDSDHGNVMKVEQPGYSAMDIDAPKKVKNEMNEINAVKEIKESAMEFGVIGQTDIVQEQNGNDENVEMDTHEEVSNGEVMEGTQSKEELKVAVQSGKLEFAEYW